MTEAENGAGRRQTDEQLLAAACTGAVAAFDELAERHAERLFRLAFRLLGSAADAEDAVQETLMGAFEQMSKFEGRSTVKTWLHRILIRQAARLHHRRARRRTSALTESGVFGGRSGRAGADVGPAADRRMDVAQALQALSFDHRQTVVLREFEGMSYAEMARAIGVPRGTVESRLHRARAELRRLLGDYLT